MVLYWIECLRRGAARELWSVLDADLRLVIALGRPPFGTRRTRRDGDPHFFITRLSRAYSWSIAAAGPRLPAPGWPPTSWVIPQLRREDQPFGC